MGTKSALTPEYDTVPGTATPPADSVKVAAVRVSGSIASLNVAAAWVTSETPVAPGAGMVVITRGAIVSASAPVEKVQAKLPANALPARSLAPDVIVAVYWVLTARFPVGRKVAMLLRRIRSYTSVPGTTVPLIVSFTVKVVIVSVAGSIGSLKVAAIVLMS